MAPRKVVRRSLGHILNDSDSGHEEQTSSPDPLDVISNKSSNSEAEEEVPVYRTRRVSQQASHTSSNSEDSAHSTNSSSRSSIKRKRVQDRANGEVNGNGRPQHNPNDASSPASSLGGTREEEGEEDEWSTFLSDTDKKQTRASGPTTTQPADSPSPDESELDLSSPTSRTSLFRLSPVRRKLADMTAEEGPLQDGAPLNQEVQEEEVLNDSAGPKERQEPHNGDSAEAEMDSDAPSLHAIESLSRLNGASNEGEALPETGDTTSATGPALLPHGAPTEEFKRETEGEPRRSEEATVITKVSSESVVNSVEEAVREHVEEQGGAPLDGIPVADEAAPPLLAEAVLVHGEATSDLAVHEDLPTNQKSDASADFVDNATDLGDAQDDANENKEMDKEINTDEAMDVDDPTGSLEHAPPTPATSAPDAEEGEEELDEEVAPTPEADNDEAEQEQDTIGDIEMEDASTPASLPLTHEGKAKTVIKKKPGPKPKPAAAKKADAANKKSLKDAKTKTKAGDTKSSSKNKTARFSAASMEHSSASVPPADAVRQGTPDSTTDRRWCVCRKRESEDDDEVTMVGCESCDDWFHPACVGLTEDQVANLDVYICRSCERSTKQKTVYKKTCKRDGCDKGLGTRESKFCSDLCAYKHMKAFTDSITTKKTLKQLSASFGAYPKPSQATIQHHKVTPPTNGRDDSTQQLINTIQTQLEATTAALEIVRKRQQILQSAIDRAEGLPPILIQAEESRSSKSKRKGGNGPSEDKQCAWDPRPIWDDAEVRDWDGEEQEEDVVGNICGLGKRKCDRHQGWQKTSTISLELEHAQLAKQRKALDHQHADLIKASEVTAESEKARAAFHDRLVAKGRAK